MSKRVPSTPSRMPICEPSPRESSMAKKRKLQKGAPGSIVNTSAITMNASPVPWTDGNNFLYNQKKNNLVITIANS